MLKNNLKSVINFFGLEIIKKSNFDKITNIPNFSFLWNLITEEQKHFIAKYLVNSKSQYAQDLFVISEMCNKKLSPFFIEFGATDGIKWSNTYLLEKEFNWEGILSEPAKVWEKQLKINRSCIIDTRCVYNISGERIEFSEILNPTDKYLVSSAELSTIKSFTVKNDWASSVRKNNSITYEVETVSLNDLLDQHNAPEKIGFLSIDTEGSELLILNSFNFNKYKIDIVIVEHNYNLEIRNNIYNLLTKNGYTRKYKEISGADDWYVL